MDRKDIYDHLARIYLDASSKSKKKRKARVSHKFFQHIFRPVYIGSAAVLCLAAAFFILLPRHKALNSEIALVFRDEAVKINFNFDPAKKEIYSVRLNGLNLSRYRAIGFSLRKVNYEDTVSIRVEMVNSFKERSEVYLKNIPARWQDYTVPLSEFKGISDFNDMESLSFIVEEWNTIKKKGIVYIDNIRVIK